MKNIALMTFCCAALSASAVDLSAWRGETVAFKLPAGEKIGRPPAGISVRTGVLQDVMYVTKAKGKEYDSVADRVLWDATMEGQRVVSLKVARDAKPGTYKFGDVKIRVTDRTLPPAKDWKYYLDLWQHPWAVARAAGVSPFSKAHYDAMRPLWKTLADAGQKTLTVTLVDLPWNHQCYDGYRAMVKSVRKADGTWTYDFGLFDEYVNFGRECGLGPHISCYTMCPWGYKVSWFDEEGRMQKAEAKPGSKFFAEYWGPFLREFTAHLKARGWFQDVYISLDERSPEDLRKTVDFLNKHAPGLKIAMAGNRKPSEFKGIVIDSYSQSLKHLTPEFLPEVSQRQKDGKLTTFYVCCSPARPNTFMDSSVDEAFWIGFFPAAAGFDGLLRWAYNSWPADPCTDASYGNWRSGDTFLVYPDGSPSIRFLSLINGIQQAEKFNILKAQGIKTSELAALAKKYCHSAAMDNTSGDFAELIGETEALLNDGCRPKQNELYAAEKAAGWKLLWDGKTLNGWVGVRKGCKAPPDKGWKIENGVLTVLPCKGIKDGKWVDLPKEQAKLGGGGDIVTEKEYRDFVFQLDFRLTKAANSGIKYFYRPDWNKGTCEEYQVLDGAHPDAMKGRDGNRRVASLYDLMPARAENIVKPLGEWNTARVVSKGTHVEHWLNGKKVLEYERGSKAFRKLVGESKYATWGTGGIKWGELETGRILLQDHSDSTVSFRNIKILEL